MAIYLSQLVNSLERGERGHVFEVRGEEIEGARKRLKNYSVDISRRGGNSLLKIKNDNENIGRKIKSRLLSLISAGLIFMIGCASKPGWVDFNQEGFNYFNRGGAMMNSVSKNFKYTVKLENLEIRYCSQEVIKNLFNRDDARAGFAWTDGKKNIVWIPVGEVDGEIMPDRSILGHEIYNITRFNDKEKKIHNVYQYFEK